VIQATDLAEFGHACQDVDHWIVISQTCNLYNSSFDKVPVFEVVGASRLNSCSPAKTRGNDPREMHVEAVNANGDGKLLLSVNIQIRKWLPRQLLANLPIPQHSVIDPPRSDWASQTTWLDNLAGWIARSYTRVALPDDFNKAVERSKLKAVFDEKLPKDADGIHGIYFELEPESEEPWQGPLGLMPPPYNLAITLVVTDNQRGSELKEKVVKQIFKDEVSDPDNQGKKITRGELAKRYQVRVSPHGIDVRGMGDINLDEIRRLIRYSMVDYLSSSGLSTPE
jgi:hypothetical protein